VVVASVAPCTRLAPIDVIERGGPRRMDAEALVSGIPAEIGQRELAWVGSAMGWDESQLRLRILQGGQGPGNAVLLTLEHEHITEVCAAFGAKKISAEMVAQQAVREAREYLASGAAVGEHLADQLMLPMALAGGGRFTVSSVSQHALTNAEVIRRFLPVAISFEQGERHSTCVVRSTC